MLTTNRKIKNSNDKGRIIRIIKKIEHKCSIMNE